MDIKETDKAYAAGLFDGEGCITTKWPSRWQAVIEIQMVHKPTIERFAEIFDCKILKCFEGDGHRRTRWRWRAYDNNAIRIIKEITPYLVEKKYQAELLVLFKETKDLGEREYYASKIKEQKSIEYV